VSGVSHTHKGFDWLRQLHDQLEQLIGAGNAARRLKQKLVREKLMASSGDRFVVQRPIFAAKGNKGHRWVHAFKASLLTG
jgi:hypothetical protein